MSARLSPLLAWAILGPPLTALAGTGTGLLALLAGEYNNHVQVRQQQIDGKAVHERRHWRFERSGEDGLTLSVAPGQSAGEPAWAFDLLPDGLATAVTAAGESQAACVYGWEAEGSGFTGRATSRDPCPPTLPRYWRVTPTHLFSGYEEQGTEHPYTARRVRYYKGWVALQRRSIDPDAARDDHVLIRDLRLHDEGSVFTITDGGQPTGYALELARLTYQNTNTPVLKLGVIDETSGATLSYAWAAPLAERIGINLRWVQAGFTLED